MPDQDLQAIQATRDLVTAAHEAQAVLARFDQARIDAICEAMAQAAQRESMRLAQLAHDETGYGKPADKNVKNRFAAETIHQYFKGLRTVGVVRDTGAVVEIAAPRGVVAAIIPSTNPTSTAIFKILISIKARNAVVLSPHPSAARCVIETANVMRAAAVQAGLPAAAIGCIELTSIEGTEALMKHKLTAVILATGGIGLVRAAYASGKPAFGVGPGNVPALIERSADVAKAVRDILAGTCFDNGTICASEQAVIVDAPLDREVRAQFAAQGAYFLNAAQAEALGKIVVGASRSLNPQIVGKSATKIAEWAGISVPPETRCLVAEAGGVGRDYPLSVEKLSPILAYYVADGLAAGSQLCDEILHFGGMGHTASIHTRSREIAVQYGLLMPTARIVVNSPSTHGAIGFSTALVPSMTLGCGSWGGNVTSDNISPLHLMDIKRVAFETKSVTGAVPAALTTSEALPLASAMAHSLPAQTNAVPAQASANQATIAALVDRVFAARKTMPPAAPPPAPPAEPKAVAPTPAPPTPDKPKPVPVAFVCEEDVRQARTNNAKIHINAKTIITPAARDLGNEYDIFARG